MIPFVKLVDSCTNALVGINANYIIKLVPGTAPSGQAFTTVVIKDQMPITVNMPFEQVEQLIHHAQMPPQC